MENIYFDPKNPGSYGGVQRLYRASNKSRKDVANFLHSQRVYTLHKPARKRFPTRRTRSSHYGSQFQADLCDMPNYKDGKYRYILTVIDVFSRYAWARPLKTKSGGEVADALREIFEEKAPHLLQTDAGKEFYNSSVQRLLKDYGVHLFSVKSPFKSSLVERYNRTLKTRMFRYFTYSGSYKWVHVLQDLVESYNHSIHRSIGMTPQEATDPNNHWKLWMQQESDSRQARATFKVGDYVRISKVKGVFTKGYLPNWSEEVFTITNVDTSQWPTVYTIADEENNRILGIFYKEELLKVPKQEWFPVEKVIRRKGQRVLVKFKGYPGHHWVSHLKDINKVAEDRV